MWAKKTKPGRFGGGRSVVRLKVKKEVSRIGTLAPGSALAFEKSAVKISLRSGLFGRRRDGGSRRIEDDGAERRGKGGGEARRRVVSW
jgi:hypothetical protein